MITKTTLPRREGSTLHREALRHAIPSLHIRLPEQRHQLALSLVDGTQVDMFPTRRRKSKIEAASCAPEQGRAPREAAEQRCQEERKTPA